MLLLHLRLFFVKILIEYMRGVDMKKYKVVSLFSGAGGMDLGFIHKNFEIIWANDFFKEATETYKKNIESFLK